MEALSATGLRSIRYAKEVPGIKEIISNDLSISAVQQIEKNVEFNGVSHLITPCQSDATTLMYNSTAPKKRFDVIDLGAYYFILICFYDSLSLGDCSYICMCIN